MTLLKIDEHLLTIINGIHSPYFDETMSILTSAVTWIPLYMVLLWMFFRNAQKPIRLFAVVTSAALCIIFCGGVDDIIIKPAVGRLRPFANPELQNTIHTVDGIVPHDYSFFSAHAANTFSIATLVSLIVKDKLLAIMLVFWSLINSYSRLYLGVHYVSDILIGTLWGLTVAIIIHTTFKNKYIIETNNSRDKSRYTSNGYDKKDIRLVTFTLIMTYLCSLTIPLL